MSADPLSVILLVILFFLLAGLAVRSFGGGARGDTVVFVGLSDSGKTSMLAKLANPEVEPKTQLSIVSNQIDYAVEKKQLKLVDIPGNEKIRLNELQKYKNALRGIVFVVNSKNIGSQVRDLAELIFQVLTDEAVHSRKPKILLAASHQDAKLAKAGEAVQKLLETELHLLRKTQAAQLKDTDERAKTEVYLGQRNTSSFTFKQLEQDGIKVEVHECSATEPNLDAVHSWLFSCA